MLTRIISGVVGVAIMAVVLYFHNTMLLPIAVAAIIAVMLFELLRAVKLHKCVPILLAVEIGGVTVPFLYMDFHYLPSGIIGGADYTIINGTPTLWSFFIVLIAAFGIFITWMKKHKEIRYEQIFFALAVMIFVPQSMSCMIRIDRADPHNGLFFLIMGLCGAWIADTGAYFTGVAFGKHKLCPEISPKKTIEGFVGGIATTGIVYAVAFSLWLDSDKPIVLSILIYFGIGALCAVVGTIGDLSASMVKRQIGFKDYGKIMPGHGGLMDRFDSILFVLPLFYVLMLFSGMSEYAVI